MERPTLSQNWNRVSRLTPMMRPQVQITRQLFRGEPWYVVHDAVSNAFFRLNPVAYHFVGLLDGHRTVDQAWNLTMDRYGDEAPTQNEVIGLLGQLNSSNLLRVDLPADAEPLLRRNRERTLKKWGGQLMNILFMRIPIANPELLLRWAAPLFRPVLSKWGLMLWLVWIVYASFQFLPHLRLFLNDVQSVLAPANWGWMVVLFIITKAWHEFGHGIVCKRFGGVVPEVGVMMLVLFPAPYVDATSSWSFDDKWKRLLVGAAGMMFELTIAAGAAIVWLHADGLVRQLCYNLVFLASVTTVLFNANPLIRFDGYYMLSDILEIPNLYDRSKQHLYWLVQRFGFGIQSVFPVSIHRGEQVALTLFGIASGIYRIVLMAGITLFIAGKLFIVGIIMALWTVISWLIVPLVKLVRWLLVDPSLHKTRSRALAVTACTVVGGVILLGLVPFPERRYASGIVESATRAELAVQADGFVEKVLVKTGDKVEEGQVIMEMINHSLTARKAELQAQLAELQFADSKALAENPVEYKMNQQRIAAVKQALEDAQKRIDDLVIRSPQAGTLVGPNMETWVGQYLKRGEVIAAVADLEQLRITALVDQAQNDSLFTQVGSHESPIGKVEVRTAGARSVNLPSRLVKVFDSGRTQLPHPALGYSGGGTIATKPDDPKGQTAINPQFELWLYLPKLNSPAPDTPTPLPGQRVYVRLTLSERRPLIWQWIRLGRQILRQRVSV